MTPASVPAPALAGGVTGFDQQATEHFSTAAADGQTDDNLIELLTYPGRFRERLLIFMAPANEYQRVRLAEFVAQFEQDRINRRRSDLYFYIRDNFHGNVTVRRLRRSSRAYRQSGWFGGPGSDGYLRADLDDLVASGWARWDRTSTGKPGRPAKRLCLTNGTPSTKKRPSEAVRANYVTTRNGLRVARLVAVG